jgi:diguanylate cyclase (GGDEF)-like protein
LLIADTHPRALKPSEVETIELVGVHAATCLDNAGMVARLRDRTERDPLTGLRNHSTFHERAEQRLRSRGDNHVVVLMADIDRFKVINDSAGHLVGDDVLRAVAEAIRGAVRADDDVFRLGGDEFAVIVTGRTERQAMALARRVRAAAETVLAPYGGALSIGLAVAAPDETRLEVVERADRALYRAKREGGDACLAALDEPRSPGDDGSYPPDESADEPADEPSSADFNCAIASIGPGSTSLSSAR